MTRGKFAGAALCAAVAHAFTDSPQMARAQTRVAVNNGERLTEADLLAGMFNGQSFTLSSDLTFDINSGGVIGRIGDGSRATAFDFAGSTVNINRSGRFEERSGVANLRLNLFNNGRVGRLFTASGATINIFDGVVEDEFGAFDSVVNMFGGSVGDDAVALDDATFTIAGGTVGHDFRALGSSVVNIVGGSVGNRFRAVSNVNIAGGVVGRDFHAQSGSRVNMTGGVVGAGFHAQGGDSVKILGGEFELDGAPIQSIPDGLPAASLLTGTLTDGSVFIFSTLAGDQIAPGSTSLRAAPLPPIHAAPIVVSAGVGPNGLRAGQTLTLTGSGSLRPNFAAVNATLNIDGGVVGEGLETAFSAINIGGGEVGRFFTAFWGSEVNIAGGSVDRDFDVLAGAVANISGGVVGDSLATRGELNISGGEVGGGLRAEFGSAVRITGGNVGDDALFFSGSQLNVSGGGVGDRVRMGSGSQATIAGGRIGSGFLALDGSETRISGGTFGRGADIRAGADAAITGGEFRLDGAPVDQLPGGGFAPGAVFTGTLADGSVFIFSNSVGDRIAPGAATLEPAALPPVDTTPMVVSTGEGPAKGLRAGQTLTITGDASLPEHFAAVDAALNVAGGTVGGALETARARVNVSGGEVGAGFSAFASEVTITGGTVGASFAAFDSVVDIGGGRLLPNFQAHAGSDVRLFVMNLRLGGSVIDLAPGESLLIAQRGGALLTATLADGSFLSLNLNDNLSLAMSVGLDFFDAGATLTATRVPTPGGTVAGLLAIGISLGLRRRGRV